MVLMILEQAAIDNLSFPTLKLKENGLILAYNLEQKCSEPFENCLFSTLELYFEACKRLRDFISSKSLFWSWANALRVILQHLLPMDCPNFMNIRVRKC